MKRMSVWGIMLLVVGGVWISAGQAETLEQAAQSLQRDIERDTAALQALRDDIAAERLPLAAELESLQREVSALREESARLRRLQLQGEREQAGLLDAAATAEEAFSFLQTLLTEYMRSVETRAGAGDLAYLLAQLAPLRTAHDPTEIEQLADTTSAVLGLAEDWNRMRFGGVRASGSALDAQGIVQPGTFLAWGPLAYFLPAQAGEAGIAVSQFGSLEPGIVSTQIPLADALGRIMDGDVASLPVDVTGGDALKVAESRTGWINRLRKGGFVMIPLLLTGALAVAIAVWKVVDLHRIRKAISADTHPVFAQLLAGDVDKAYALAGQLSMPLAPLVEAAIAHRSVPREHLEEILHEHVLGVLPRLERYLGALGVLGGVAPLLGLLGTVTGMIHTFQLVTIFGSGDARLLSGGISEALVTTETGLIIAVPVLLVHAYLMRRAREIVAALERVLAHMVNQMTLGEDAP